MTPFRINDAVFIESAYLSGEAKMSISVRPTGGARGPQSVEAIIGLPGGMFVKHRGAWNFCPWANVKSASLVDVPPEVEALAPVPPAPAPYKPVETRHVRAEPFVVAPSQPVDYIEALAPHIQSDVAPAVPAEPPSTTAAPPARDAMGVLLSVQPTTGPMIECSGCGVKFIRGATHACTSVRPADDLV